MIALTEGGLRVLRGKKRQGNTRSAKLRDWDDHYV